MDIKKMWKNNKKIIVMTGLGVGLLSIFDFLPATIDFFGDYTSMVYGGVVVLGAYTFYNFYWRTPFVPGRVPVRGYDKYVQSRDLKNKKFEEDVRGRKSGVSEGKDGFENDEGLAEGRKRSSGRSSREGSEVFERFKNEG